MARVLLSVIVAGWTIAVSSAEEPLHVTFVEVAAEAGIGFRHFTGALGERYMPETMGSGVAIFDYDNDGDLDAVFANGRRWTDESGEHTPKLYRNRGDGTFEDATEEAGIDVPMYGMGVVTGDIDNDDDADLYFTNVGDNVFFRNEGDGTFINVTEEARLHDPGWSTGAVFLDYDRDGYLDLFVGHYVVWSPETDLPCAVADRYRSYCTPSVYPGESNRLYRNLGDGTFDDVTEKAGIFNPNGKSLSATLLDYDDDGWIDIAVANDTEPNFLYHNNGDGTFTDEGVFMGVAFDESGRARGSMGIDAADPFNEGGLALAVGNFANEMTAFFYRAGEGFFADRARQVQVGTPSLLALTFGLFFFDFDLDGNPDLFHVNGHIEPDAITFQENVGYAQRPSLFWNRGDRTFKEIAARIGMGAVGVGRGAAYGDLDGDGDLDILVSNSGVLPKYATAWYLRNDGGNANHYLRVRLVGVESNRDAIGAKVTVTAGGVTQRQLVRSGGSYCSDSERTLTFGLGDHDAIERLEIRWPSGHVDRFDALPVDRTWRITEGGTADEW